MNIEDSLRVKESGSPHLQDGCEHREGSRPSFLCGNEPLLIQLQLSLWMCVAGVKSYFLFFKSQQHGASHRAKSEAHVHLKPNTQVPKLPQSIFIS